MSNNEKGKAIAFVLGPVVVLIGLIYLFAYINADFVPGGRGIF